MTLCFINIPSALSQHSQPSSDPLGPPSSAASLTAVCSSGKFGLFLTGYCSHGDPETIKPRRLLVTAHLLLDFILKLNESRIYGVRKPGPIIFQWLHDGLFLKQQGSNTLWLDISAHSYWPCRPDVSHSAGQKTPCANNLKSNEWNGGSDVQLVCQVAVVHTALWTVWEDLGIKGCLFLCQQRFCRLLCRRPPPV